MDIRTRVFYIVRRPMGDTEHLLALVVCLAVTRCFGFSSSTFLTRRPDLGFTWRATMTNRGEAARRINTSRAAQPHKWPAGRYKVGRRFTTITSKVIEPLET